MDTLPAIFEAYKAIFLLHPYVFIFIGLFVFGETVFLPALYFALFGPLNVTGVLALAMSAAVLSDLVWYGLGRFIPRERLARMIGKRVETGVEKFSEVFAGHRLKTIFISKFVYGTRTAVQVLAGMWKTPFVPYIAVNFAGTGLLVSIIVIIAVATKSGVENFTDTVHNLEIVFAIFAGVIIATQLVIHRIVSKKWFQR